MAVHLLRAALLAGLAATLPSCGVAPPALAPRAALDSAKASATLGLVADRISLANLPGGHAVRVAGAPGAARGGGVWGSPGRHAAPASGDEAAVEADGSFVLELHAHPGEAVTLWAYRDDASGRRRYASPLVFVAPAAPRAAR
ncbi:MAG: hypothetical protein VKQ33_04305 [Candidatus Sericytochromatia bacterium]|nr:hypothetical protein [Candidatus Sericytochromatia bacterium]